MYYYPVQDNSGHLIPALTLRPRPSVSAICVDTPVSDRLVAWTPKAPADPAERCGVNTRETRRLGTAGPRDELHADRRQR